MPRQSITFTNPNDDWLKSQVDSQEYNNKSDVVNDLGLVNFREVFFLIL